MRVAIIGAGPTGCIAAAAAATKGYNVKIYEEHKRIGYPVRCAGLISETAAKLFRSIGIKKIHSVNEIRNIFIRCGPKAVILKVKAFVISREKFDQECAELAESASAKILNAKIDVTQLRSLNYDILIGADGANSLVASCFSFPKMQKAIAYQCSSDYDNSNIDRHSAFVELFKGSFGYVIPENEERVRVGLCAFGRASFEQFKSFLKALKIEKMYGTFCALIPAEVRQKVQAGRVFLVGDAAGAVKATSLGGLYYGCRSALLAAECIESLEYEKRFRAELFPELLPHQVVRKFAPLLLTFLPNLVFTYDMERITSIRPRLT